MNEAFTFDTRLGVLVLRDDLDLRQFSEAERKEIAGQWMLYCAGMTNRVKDLEEQIMEKLEAMYEAKTEGEMHRLNDEMMEIASVVCDLNILSRSAWDGLARAHF